MRVRQIVEQDSSPSLRQGWLWLGAAVLSIYAQVATHAFNNYDDPTYITNNTLVKGGLTLQGIRWAFSEDTLGMWHPVTLLSHMLDWQVFGPAAAGHLAVNVALHAFNAGLLFVLLRRMTGAGWPSFVVALLFAVHPLNVESVAWASQRKTTLSGLFFLLTLIAWHQYRTQKSMAAYVLAIASYWLGLMSKPVLVTLPCVLLLLDYWPLRREKWNAREVIDLLLEKAPFAVLALVALVIMFSPGGAPSDVVSEHGFTGQRWLRALANTVVYLRKVAWPADLAVLYPHRPIVSGAELIWAIVVVSALTALAWRNGGPVLIGWLWFLGTIFPMSGVMPIGPHEQADRYAYLSGIGLFIMAAWLMPTEFWTRSRWQIGVAIAAVGLSFGVVAWRQVKFWQNSLTLWTRDATLYPPSVVQQVNYGNALAGAGRFDEAEKCFQLVAAFNPHEAKAFIDLATIRNHRGDKTAAIALLEQALQADPRHAGAHRLLGSLLHDVGRTAEGQGHLETAISLDPALAAAHVDLGVLLAQRGDLSVAERHFEIALRIQPEDQITAANLALVRAQLAVAQKRPGP